MSSADRLQLDITLRARRQLTLPAEICDALGLAVGDRLEIAVSDEGLLVRPKKAVALSALSEIQAAFARSDLTEEDLQSEGRKIRERLTATRYGEE